MIYRYTNSTTAVIDRQEFEAIPQAEKDKFYKEANGEGIAKTLDKVESLLTNYTVQEDAFLESGKFLPLSAWTVKGFNTANIERNAREQDKQWHNELEDQFAMLILTVGNNCLGAMN